MRPLLLAEKDEELFEIVFEFVEFVLMAVVVGLIKTTVGAM